MALMQITLQDHRKKQNITTVGLKTCIDYSTIKTNTNVKPSSVIAVSMVLQKRTYLSNTKKTVMESTKSRQEQKCLRKAEVTLH